MVSHTSRLAFIAVAAICGAALAQPARGAQAAPGAQPSRAVDLAEREQRLLEQIDELRDDGGSNAEGLIAPLQALGLLHQEAGDHVGAVDALQRARQVIRANRGLFSATVDEALVLRQQIQSEKALGNGARVWDLQFDLIAIARQHLDDIRVLPIFLELIEDRAQRLEEFSTTQFADLRPGLFVPCVATQGPYGARTQVSDAKACDSASWRRTVEVLQGAVLRSYADAIAVLIRNGDYASEELRSLERQALRLVPFEREWLRFCSVGTFTEFLQSELADSCMDTASGSNVGGWASLMRLVWYEVRSGAPPAVRAHALAEIADWYLRAEHVDDRRKLSPADAIALQLYEMALAQLGEGEEARDSIAEIFSPDLPVMLPTYAPNPLATMQSPRFIDMTFQIGKYGEAAEIQILDTSRNATRAEERALVRLVKYGSFRPRAVDGALAEAAPVVVRYYLSESSSAL